DPPWAALSAFAWWDDNRANRTADRGDTAEAVLAVSRHVNLGNPDSGRMPNGYAHRLDAFLKAAAAIRREAGMAPGAPLDAWPEPEPPDPRSGAADVSPIPPRPPSPLPTPEPDA